MTTVITVCDTCMRDEFSTENQSIRHGEILARLIDEEAKDSSEVIVRRHSCLMGCERACNVAIQSADKIQYMVGSFEPTAESAQGIVEYAKLHANSASGQVPYKTWPTAIKGHFVARLPKLETSEDQKS